MPRARREGIATLTRTGMPSLIAATRIASTRRRGRFSAARDLHRTDATAQPMAAAAPDTANTA